ncbi:MAG: dATP/dGTP diphosphohydrolase domain-containing protein [Planctomycetota bacterium]
MSGTKLDNDKPSFWLIPHEPLLEVAKVLTYGASKYEEDPHDRNYLRVEDGERRYLDAVLRHMNSHLRGEKSDPESGLSHLAHAASSLLMAMGWRSARPGDTPTYAWGEDDTKP